MPEHLQYKYCCQRCCSLDERSKDPSAKPQRNKKQHGPACYQIPYGHGYGTPGTMDNELEPNSPPSLPETCFPSSSSSSITMQLVAAPVASESIIVPITPTHAVHGSCLPSSSSSAMPLIAASVGNASIIVPRTPIHAAGRTCSPPPIEPVRRTNDAARAGAAVLPYIQRRVDDGEMSDLDRILCMQTKAIPNAPPQALLRADEGDAKRSRPPQALLRADEGDAKRPRRD